MPSESKPTNRIVVPHAFRTRLLSAHVELKPMVKVRDTFALKGSSQGTGTEQAGPSTNANLRCSAK